MWPYSPDENDWLGLQRPKPKISPTDLPTEALSDRIAAHLKHAHELRADAFAQFMRNLFGGSRRPRTKH